MKKLLIVLLGIVSISSYSQPVYQMSNMVVYDCEGILTDSDAGVPSGNYSHNESYIFTIQAPIVTPIIFSFSEFCTESSYDTLMIYDGPDIFSPLIAGPLSGINLPSQVVANSGSLTITFFSDANVACTGWVANWEVDIEDPITPFFSFDSLAAACETDVIDLYFDQLIFCDSVGINSFQIFGSLNQVITDVSSNNCTLGYDSVFTITLDPGLDSNGLYTFDFTYTYIDECNEVFILDTTNTLLIEDCPLWVNLILDDDSICPNECVYASVFVSGGDSTSYTYTWNNGFPNNSGPHLICPDNDSLISVVVSDLSPSTNASDSEIIYLFDEPEILLTDTMYCINVEVDTLYAIPIGGQWFGTGIIDNSLGIFDPGIALPGPNQIYYTSINGCSDSTIIYIDDIQAGPDLAVCSGSSAFQILSGFPLGGQWSGLNIDNDGTYYNHVNPLTTGAFTVVYTLDACVDSLIVNIDSLQINFQDSLCVNEPPFALNFSPIGGIWTGNGITDINLGIYNPMQAGVGTDTLIYSVIGCLDTIFIHNAEIYAGEDFYACPLELPFQLSGLPSGGIWSGTGIIDSVQGIFDPGDNGGSNFTSDLIYSYLGCTDTIEAKVRLTKLDFDTISFCEYEDYMVLNYGNTGRWPPDGFWSGVGVVPNDPWSPRFHPSVSGVGLFTIYYEINSCLDSVVMKVNPKPTITSDTSMCSQSALVNLIANPENGVWNGNGIIDTTDGLFDPSIAVLGVNEIIFHAEEGCSDTLEISVYGPPQLSIIGLDSIYCFQDSAYPIVGIPIGSTLYGDGVNIDEFNPSIADSGFHYVYITDGWGDCQVWDSSLTFVYPEIETEVFVNNDTLCYGDSTIISVVSTGGNGNLYDYFWNLSSLNNDSILVTPGQPTTFVINVSDHCSDDGIDSGFVYVHPEILYQINANPAQCFGTIGFAEVVMNVPGDYSYYWNSNPPQITSILYEYVDDVYNVTITNNITGCIVDTFTYLPSFEFINANFIANPNNDCVLLTNPEFEFLDLSVGGDIGTWDFGNGVTDSYYQNYNPHYIYQDTGSYVVTLIIENFGGCTDTIQEIVCVEGDYLLNIPNTFTPNADNLNDEYKLVGVGIRDFNMKIFNRWGEMIFETNNINLGWDGTYKNKLVSQDSYIYLVKARVLDNNEEVTKTFKGMLYLLR